MRLEEKVKVFEELRSNDYILSKGQSAKDILELALSELGNLDGYIRDELALETAAYMIYKGYLSDGELLNLAERLISDEFLFYGLKTEKKIVFLLEPFHHC